jgi:Tol biopolymer transport system component
VYKRQLWADWNPAQLNQIAYTTAKTTNLPPGWEANNDLWLGLIPAHQLAEFEPILLIESYAATYGWWGGNYAWSPGGTAIAYSYADEVGVIDLTADRESSPHRPLQRFTDYNTLADWVWLPTLTWSPDGRFIAFTNHNSEESTGQVFDSWLVDTVTGAAGRIVTDTGMWGHLHWAPVGGTPYTNTTPLSYTIPITEAVPDSQIAFLKTTNSQDSQRSPYVLWLMDRDGSNGRRLYPEVGENAFFPREQRFMAWAPDGRFIAFIHSQTLHLYNLLTHEVSRITQDDAPAAYPTWAPYGSGKLKDGPVTAVTIPALDSLTDPDSPEPES